MATLTVRRGREAHLGRVGASKSMGLILVLRVPLNLSLTACLEAASSASISLAVFLRVAVTVGVGTAAERGGSSVSRLMREGETAPLEGAMMGACIAVERSAGAQVEVPGAATLPKRLGYSS